MLIRLKSDSTDPVYVQIAEAIRTQMESTSMSLGDRLPPARVLAASLSVNMHTVLKAYAELEANGLVEKRRGRGGVVVASGDNMKSLVDGLVSNAKGRGLSFPEVVKLVEEAW